MSSFLCFICHSTVSKETNEETRDKYREVVGMNLCPDSQLCYICCHVLNKLSLFRSICLKRSLEYPVLFREKGTLNLQKSDLELNVLCPEDCNQYQRSKIYQFTHDNDANDTNDNNDNEYVKLEHDNDYNDYFTQCQYQNVKNNDEIDENNYHCKSKNVNNFDFTPKNYINEALGNESNDIHEYSEEENDGTDAHDYCEVENNENNTNLNGNEQIIENLNISNKNINNETETERKLVNDYPQNEDFIDKTMEIDEINVNNEATDVLIKKKVKKRKKKGYKKIILSLEEQKAELEANRKGKKYIESEFKCFNCALGFLFKDTYQAHMMRHEESNGQHQCETCTLRFSTLALLRAHMANHKEIYICTRCGLNLRPRAQRGHNCTIKEVETVSCHLCGNLFKDASGLQQHVRRVHTRKRSGRMHSCGACGDGFSTQRALRTHMIKHVSHTFACSQCGAQFRSPYSRAAHERTHARSGRAHACQCGALFASRKGLVEHRRRSARHQSVLFECPICGRICPTQRALSSHMQTIHGGHGVQLDTGVPVNTGVQLNTRVQLNTGVQLDTGVQMDTGVQTDNVVQGVQIQAHTCPICPARYTTRKSLLRHIRGHSGKSDVKMAVCHLCGNSYKGNSKLNRHLKEVCEKAKLEEEISALYE